MEMYIEESHKTAVKNGFWDFSDLDENKLQALVKLILINSEVDEAMREIRVVETDWEAFGEELVDIVIRTWDLYGVLQSRGLISQDFEDTLTTKMAKNKTRPYRHGKAF
jgi:NTP pyrophosphatase (non-canonical NTP hydrolase)